MKENKVKKEKVTNDYWKWKRFENEKRRSMGKWIGKKEEGSDSLSKRNQFCFSECAFILAFAHFME